MIPCCLHGIQGYGPLDAQIMFIGIAPGRDEATVSKRPFTGPAGKFLQSVLSAYDITLDDCYCTNLICWWKDKPNRDEIQSCHQRLLKEIGLINPKVIVLLGGLVCETFLGRKLSQARGAVIPINNFNHDDSYYLVTNHPAAALHPDNKEQQINAAYDIIRDLGKLPHLLNDEYTTLYEQPITYTLINTIEEAQNLLNNLSEFTVALDIETKYDKEADWSHPFSDQILCIGIGYEDSHAYVLAGEALSPSLKWPKYTRWLYHNGQFDTQEIAQHLHTWLPISEDTMLQSYTCDERNERGLHKLKHLAREYCGADFYEEDEHHPEVDEQTGETNYAKLYEYNARDVCYTYRLHNYLSDRQKQEDVSLPYESLLLPAAEMLARSQFRGIYINPQNVNHIEATFAREYILTKRELTKLATDLGFPELNVRSPIQLKAMLHAQGHFVANTTKYTLQDLADDDNLFIQKLLRYRTLDRLITNYLHNVLEQVKYDGRVHPHAFLPGTVTGRLTYKDPAMQTLPKPKTVKDLGVIRSIFSATNDDYILVEADYAQIEAWLGAYFSQDPTLLADLQSGDWHTYTTTDVFKVTRATVNAQQWAFYRDGGKHLNYGCMFGEGPQGLTRKPPIGMGCDIQTARLYHKRWYERYHVFGDYQRQQQALARNEAEIITPFGRKRRFPVIVNDHQLRQAINYEIQSTASDYTISSAIRLWPKLEQLDSHLLFIEHDALYYEVNRSNLEEVLQLIKVAMERPPLPNLPSIKIEIDIGHNLAEMIPQKDWIEV